MRVHYFMHVPYEGLGSLEYYFVSRGWQISATRWFAGERAPNMSQIDLLIVMGGPMSVGDEREHPWLVQEKQAIEQALHAGVPAIGVCLGGQLLATVMGAEVKRNKHTEIGWFPLQWKLDQKNTLLQDLPEVVTPFHWHSDTFDIPSGATCFASSEACANQGFYVKSKVLALQFHFEMLPSDVVNLYEACGTDLSADTYVQTVEQVLSSPKYFTQASRDLTQLVNNFLSTTKSE